MIESRYPLRPLGEVLDLDRHEVDVQPTETYRTAGLYNHGRGLFEREPIMGSETAYKTYFRLAEGQMVFSRLFAFEGSIAMVGPAEDGLFVSNEFPTLTPRWAQVDEGFLSGLVMWPEFHSLLARAAKGMGLRRRRVHPDSLLELEVPLPEVDEQRRVARRTADALKRTLGMASASSFSPPALFRLPAAIVNEQQNNPGVRPTRLGDVLALERTLIDVVPDATYRTIGMRSFGKGLIRYPEKPGSELGKLRFSHVPADALALSNIKAWEGAVTTTVGCGAGLTASNRFLFYRPIDGACDVQYVAQVLLSEPGLRALGQASPGSADRNRTLAASRFEDIVLDLPPPEVQHELARSLDQLADPMHELDRLLAHRATVIDALTPSILNLAFAGLM